MNKGELMNIQSNLFNGNIRDARKLMVEYGIKDFPLDYLEYLQSLYCNNDYTVLLHLSVALKQFSYC